ncbi:YheV family putative zinc ribbon protein [uncultured Marinobacter sp.]|uniref:YheV family putative zinc ribbon protein n=1 Tax=uncultured Marinobacter sp. TaxID=187379 RepID=UPI0030D96008|tara:strand:- start:422 stop:673 length:252 start_codon:yes stop_codon:yes gene_type:complete
MPTPKRFIAGAVCPRCAEMDKLTMYTDDNETQHRECVSCGFTDTQGDPAPGNAELQTRVNKRKNEDDHTVKQVVFFKAGSSDE